PVRGTRPKVGRKPVTPQVRAGDGIEPLVSEPMLNPTQPAEVADAGPADEPLDPGRSWSGIHGFRVYPFHHRLPWASEPPLSSAPTLAPASSTRLTTAAS